MRRINNIPDKHKNKFVTASRYLLNEVHELFANYDGYMQNYLTLTTTVIYYKHMSVYNLKYLVAENINDNELLPTKINLQTGIFRKFFNKYKPLNVKITNVFLQKTKTRGVNGVTSCWVVQIQV